MSVGRRKSNDALRSNSLASAHSSYTLESITSEHLNHSVSGWSVVSNNSPKHRQSIIELCDEPAVPFAMSNSPEAVPRSDKKQFIAALDVGTTTLRCHIVNSSGDLVGQHSVPTKLIHPQPGYAEIPHDLLLEDSLLVIKSAIENASLSPTDISTLGITTQRATFITWRRDSGVPFHNFITWKDIRCNDLVKQWNNSLIMKSFKSLCYTMYLFTRQARFLAGSSIKFTSSHTTMRLLWVLNNIEEMRDDIDNVMFGTVETWLLYQLTKGKTYISDFGNASSTGLVDPFESNWSSFLHSILGIPTSIYPTIVANDDDYGKVDKEFFGVEIPIGSVMADQQSSMIGSCCYQANTLKLTLGTGSFLNIVTPKLHPGVRGIYPVIYYKLKDKFRYMAEGACNDTATIITWALLSGFCKTPDETSTMAQSVKSSEGVYFIPAFSGLGPPIYDEKAATGFFGIKPTTTKEHMVRAMLESIVFRIMLQYNTLRKELDNSIEKIYIDGGVSKNDFICQMISNMTELRVERAHSTELSVLGVAYIAGLNSGIWSSIDELSNLRKVEKVFTPSKDLTNYESHFAEFEVWQKVITRFKAWYK